MKVDTAEHAARVERPRASDRRFFIAGCQRSGTTLMRLILESHTDIACFDEQYSYEILAGRRAPPRPASEVADFEIVGFKIPVWSEQLLQARLHWNEYAYLYGSATIPNFYDREPLIFMLRSPLDTVSSMLKLSVENDSWLHRVAVPVVHAMSEGARLSDEFEADLKFALACSDPEVAIGALYWKIKSSAALSYLDTGLPVHVVAYERFVANPATFLPGILQHIGVRWDDSVLKHHQIPHGEVIDGKAIGGTDPTRPIDTRSIGHSAIRLSPCQVGLIERIAGDLARTLSACAVSVKGDSERPQSGLKRRAFRPLTG